MRLLLFPLGAKTNPARIAFFLYLVLACAFLLAAPVQSRPIKLLNEAKPGLWQRISAAARRFWKPDIPLADPIDRLFRHDPLLSQSKEKAFLRREILQNDYKLSAEQNQVPLSTQKQVLDNTVTELAQQIDLAARTGKKSDLEQRAQSEAKFRSQFTQFRNQRLQRTPGDSREVPSWVDFDVWVLKTWDEVNNFVKYEQEWLSKLRSPGLDWNQLETLQEKMGPGLELLTHTIKHLEQTQADIKSIIKLEEDHHSSRTNSNQLLRTKNDKKNFLNQMHQHLLWPDWLANWNDVVEEELERLKVVQKVFDNGMLNSVVSDLFAVLEAKPKQKWGWYRGFWRKRPIIPRVTELDLRRYWGSR
ncbi:hypothetical protein ACQY0O_005560 [Thecaphora frezii]